MMRVPWYAEFEKSLAKREGVEKVESYSWNTPQSPAEPAGSEQSAIAHEHIKRIAQEYFRLKNKIDRGFGKQMDMSTEQLIEKAGSTAEEIIQLKAEALRKREPHLTEAQAFSKVYTAPENLHLRRAEREARGFIRYTDDPVGESVPVATLEPRIEQDMAMGELKKLAEEIRRSHPFKTNEQLFAMAATARPDLLKREPAAARAAMGVGM